MKLFKKDWLDIPVIALIAANTIPLFGVVFLDWDAFSIVLLYWSENLVIGFYNILKIAFAAVPHPIAHLVKFYIIPFFTIHYGIFTLVHGLFIFSIFKKNLDLNPLAGKAGHPLFLFIHTLYNISKQIYSTIPMQMKFAILSLFISHGVSFIYNYLLKGEYASDKSPNLLASPYKRVIIMQFAILGGAYWAMTIGSPAALLLILIVLKTIFDVKLHQRSHKKVQNS